MDEQRNPTKPILGKYIYNAYNIQWSESDDTTVRGLLKKYRVRLSLMVLSMSPMAIQVDIGTNRPSVSVVTTRR
jgi:hypothetical protein